MKVKKLVALALTVAMGATLFACGGSTSTGGTGATGGSAGGDKTITFWSVFTGGDGTAMQKIVDAYNATNPEYQVEHVMIEQGNLYTQLSLVVNSQEGVPDLVIQHVDRMPSNAANNMYMPLDDYIAANGKISGDNYIDTAWNLGEIDGVRYGIPLDLHSYVTYYNKALVDQYCPGVLDDGIVTFDEIASFADDAAAAGVYTYAITWPRYELLSWYYQLGGQLTENGTDPAFNLALEETLFDTLSPENPGMFLIWRNAPSVIIGCHQNTAEEVNEPYCREHGIALQAWSPLMQGAILKEPLVLELAKKYGRTPAQIVLRWDLQTDFIAVAKSKTPERIRSNARIFDFELSRDDVAALSAMNAALRCGPNPETFDMHI